MTNGALTSSDSRHDAGPGESWDHNTPDPECDGTRNIAQ